MSTKTSTRKSTKAAKRQPVKKSELVFDNKVEMPGNDWDLDFKIKQDYDLTERQQVFFNTALQEQTRMCIVDGPAGTAKTYIAVLAALKLLHNRQIDNIVYIRSIVESASRSMGALPGELEEKFAPWSMPLIDKLDEILVGNTSNNLMPLTQRAGDAEPSGRL